MCGLEGTCVYVGVEETLFVWGRENSVCVCGGEVFACLWGCNVSYITRQDQVQSPLSLHTHTVNRGHSTVE